MFGVVNILARERDRSAKRLMEDFQVNNRGQESYVSSPSWVSSDVERKYLGARLQRKGHRGFVSFLFVFLCSRVRLNVTRVLPSFTD